MQTGTDDAGPFCQPFAELAGSTPSTNGLRANYRRIGWDDGRRVTHDAAKKVGKERAHFERTGRAFILEEGMKMTAIGFGVVSAALAASFAFGMMVEAKRNSQADAKKDVRVTGIGGVFFKA